MSVQRLLETVRVIDLSQYIPGPFATRQLADLGAEVIKVEPPGGDPMRRFMYRQDNGPSPVYYHLNRGKRVVELDLKSESGREALAALIEDADILLESYRPGVLARLGFDPEVLDRLNPDLIHCALSGYGQTGPLAQRAGHDINYCALSSQSIVSGTAERPVIGYPPIADHVAAMQAAIAMLAALQARKNQTGGTYIDISLAESVLSWQYLPMLVDADERAANILNGGAACYNLYCCADGQFASIGAIEPGFWKNFCTAVDRPDWISRQYDSMPQLELIAEVAELFAQHACSHWCQRLESVDCCFQALSFVGNLGKHPHFESRQAINEAGPTYPAWINRQPVEIATTIEMIDPARPPAWLTTGS